MKIDIDQGRFISYLDEFRYFCVIGSEIAKKIEAMGVDPLYKEIQVGRRVFYHCGYC